MASPAQAQAQVVKADDTFVLHDLKVDIICPKNERILCGAKDGDYFTLEGEMLKLPPGQGISIYSLSTDLRGFEPSRDILIIEIRCCAPAPGCKTEDNTPKRLDDHRCRDCVSDDSRFTVPNTDGPLSCPDPNCKSRMKITRTKERVFSHGAVTAVPLNSEEGWDRAPDDAIKSFVKNSKRNNTINL